MKNTHHQHNSTKGLSLAFWLNLLFSIIEVIGGILTNSTAIIIDAIHDFTDAIAIGSAVWVERFSKKKRSATFSYGYRRFSMLSALLLSVFLWFGASIMVYNAILSFVNPKEVHSVGMLWLSVLGIAVNGFAFLKIKNGGGHHHHTHNHNSQAIMLHLLEDVLGWIAVLIGAAVIYFTNWYWIDGVLAIAIAVFIGYNATGNIISTMKVLMQSVPESVNVEGLMQQLKEIKGVKSFHDLHIWSLDGNYHVGSLHAVIDKNNAGKENEILLQILDLLEEHHIHHPTVQIEAVELACGLTEC